MATSTGVCSTQKLPNGRGRQTGTGTKGTAYHGSTPGALILRSHHSVAVRNDEKEFVGNPWVM